MNKYLIITNNYCIRDTYTGDRDISIELLEGGYLDVLLAIRDKVHLGYKIITHPLMGSVKPNETPYRSIILETGDSLDLQSLEIIESSIAVCKKFLNNKKTPDWNEKIREDFRYVDCKLFASAYETIKM